MEDQQVQLNNLMPFSSIPLPFDSSFHSVLLYSTLVHSFLAPLICLSPLVLSFARGLSKS